ISHNEDPPADPEVGQQMVASIVDAVMHSPQWPHAAIFITYDEQGGFYDHVPPPTACVPDDIPPDVSSGVVAAYDQLCLSIPRFVVSPYAKGGYVSHEITDHTSVARFVEARFDLPALTHRDANAVPPFGMFDFAHPDLSIPALPAATLDPVKYDACKTKYP